MDEMLQALRARRGQLAQKKVQSKEPSKTKSLIDQVKTMNPDEKKQLLRMLGIPDQVQDAQEKDKMAKTGMYEKDESDKKKKELINTRIKEIEDELSFGENEEEDDSDSEIPEDVTMKVAEGMVDRKYLNNTEMKPRSLHDRAQMKIAQLINSKKGK